MTSQSASKATAVPWLHPPGDVTISLGTFRTSVFFFNLTYFIKYVKEDMKFKSLIFLHGFRTTSSIIYNYRVHLVAVIIFNLGVG